MAVELAKVSLWLDCFTLGAPLSFLDHHLKCGNSLIGAQVETVRVRDRNGHHHPQTQGGCRKQKGSKTVQSIGMQFDMFGSMWTGAMLATDLMRQVGELSDVTAEQVRQSRQEYKKAADELAPFKLILDVYTSRWFGNDDTKQSQPTLLFLRDGANMAWLKSPRSAQTALKSDAAKIAVTTLKAAREKRFFHWELEFPEVFFGPSKNSAQEIVLKENAGFDAVIGNPPYGYRMIPTEQDKSFFQSNYQSHQYDFESYFYFTELGAKLISPEARLGFITPHTFLSAKNAKSFREYLLDKAKVYEIDYLGLHIFEGVTVQSVLLFVSPTNQANSVVVKHLLPDIQPEILHFSQHTIPLEKIGKSDDRAIQISLKFRQGSNNR